MMDNFNGLESLVETYLEAEDANLSNYIAAQNKLLKYRDELKEDRDELLMTHDDLRQARNDLRQAHRNLLQARKNRDGDLPSVSQLASRHFARVRGIFAAHDSKVNKILAEANPASAEAETRLPKLHQALRARISTYFDSLKELSHALGLPPSEQLTNSRAHSKESLIAYVDEVASYFGEVAGLLEGGAPFSEKQDILAVRVKRDLALSIFEMPNSQFDQRLIRHHLANYDNTVDTLITTTAITQESTDSETLHRVHRLFADRLKNESVAKKLWLRVWIAGSALGLMAIVAAFLTSLSGSPNWSWIAICLAGLGSLVAALYTFGATRELSVRGKWILVALPVLVLVFALILPRQDRQIPVTTTVVAIFAVAVLGGMSLWVVRHEPSEPHLRSGLSSRSLGLLRGSASSGSETTDWDRYLVADELATLRARILQEAGKQRKASIAWATTFILVGGLAALLSGAAGVTATQIPGEAEPTANGFPLNALIIGLAIGGAGLTALMTALNPGRRWEQARTLQLACQSLEQEVGVLIRLDLGGSVPSDDNGREKLEEIATMYDTLLGVPERPRLWRDTSASATKKRG